MSQTTFEQRRAGWRVVGKEERASHSLFKWIAMATVLAAGLVWLGGFQYGHSAVGGLTTQKGQLQQQLSRTRWQDRVTIDGLEKRIRALLLHRAHCYTDDSDIQNIQRLVDQANYKMAAGLAQLDLTNKNKPVCPGTQSALAQIWYTASINGLLATPVTSPLDGTPVLAWRGIERRADALGISSSERLSPLTIFTMSYNNHLWQLGRASFLVAWKAQLVGPSNLTLVQTYYADMTNLGLALTRQVQGADKRRGYSLLATAAAIGKAYGVGDEASADLQRLGHGPWPKPDWSEAVLAGSKSGD